MPRTSNRTAQTDPVAALAAQVAALTELVASLAGNTTAAPTPAPAKAPAKAAKAAKVYSWKPWACSKFGIPATVGASFAYNGKNGTTDHVVVGIDADGTVRSTRA